MTAASVIEWVWRRDAIAHARARKISVEQRRCVDRARAAANLADTAYEGIDSTSSDAGASLSIGLYGQAAYWALRSLDDAAARGGMDEVLDRAPVDVVEKAAGGSSGWARLRGRFTRSFVDHAQATATENDEDARLAKRFVDDLLAVVDARHRTVESIWIERVVRVGFVALALLILVSAPRLFIRPKNYAAGHSWHASSSNGVWPQNGLMDGARRPFFHTASENGPWVEIDLGQARDIGTIEVDNRADCCAERAVPLIAEISNDDKSWQEVARRGDVFSTWTAKFSPRRARYVRLRAARLTVLHLDNVQVQPPR